MARPQSRLNSQKSEVIEKNFLEQNPDIIPSLDEQEIVVVKKVPEMRKFVFLNGRDPGQALYFHYASKGCPLKQYTLYHGKEHILPVEIVEHLEDCKEPVYAYKKGESGFQEHYISSYKYIFQCKNVKQAA